MAKTSIPDADGLPQPLTPTDCDLRGMPYMPLDIVRLFDSDLYALSTGDEFKAALTLWGKSFLQVPAGSLSADDRILAHLSGAGARWPKVRAMALRGWVKCSDGRYYHPVVAEKARDAMKARTARIERTEAARRARHGTKPTSVDDDTEPHGKPVTSRHGSSVTEPVTDPVATSVTDNVTSSKGREGKGREGKKEERADTDVSDAEVASSEFPDARMRLWREGIPILTAMIGKPPAATRSMLGKMLRHAGDDCPLLLGVLRDAADARPADPSAWIAAAVLTRRAPPVSAAEKRIRANHEAMMAMTYPDDEGLIIEHEPEQRIALQ